MSNSSHLVKIFPNYSSHHQIILLYHITKWIIAEKAAGGTDVGNLMTEEFRRV